jgi:hypothetical protein
LLLVREEQTPRFVEDYADYRTSPVSMQQWLESAKQSARKPGPVTSKLLIVELQSLFLRLIQQLQPATLWHL